MFIALAIAQQITSSSAGCTFIPHPWFPDDFYTCEISGANISNENEVLDFSGTHIGSRTNADVTTVRFVNSQIDVIPSNVFTTFTDMRILEANNVGLKRLNVGSLRNCTSLRELNLADNLITRLENGVFRPCAFLINLAGNQLTAFAPNLFQRIDNVASVNLSHNHITEIPPNAFRNIGLVSLNLNHNSISKIGFGAFSGFGTRNIRAGGLQLNNNRMERLTNDMFGTGWFHVNSFSIAHNGLVAIQRGFFNIFEPSPAGTSVFAEGNNCIDDNFRLQTLTQLRNDFENCFANF